jgi:hypothetical protein
LAYFSITTPASGRLREYRLFPFMLLSDHRTGLAAQVGKAVPP